MKQCDMESVHLAMKQCDMESVHLAMKQCDMCVVCSSCSYGS